MTVKACATNNNSIESVSKPILIEKIDSNRYVTKVKSLNVHTNHNK